MNKLCLVALAISLQASDIRISEVMSNPQGSEYENEFIEIYNHSEHVIQVNGWVISDGTGIDTLIHLSGPVNIQAMSYALILDPGYSSTAGPYLGLIPDSIPIYTISTDATFGSGGFTNSGESAIIRNQDSSMVSQMSWTSSSENGYSWERISLDVPDSLAEWQQSLVENGTPGFRNSAAKPAFNLALNWVELTQALTSLPVNAVLAISNTGEERVNGFSIMMHKDENQNGIQEDSEWRDSLQVFEPVEPQAELELSISLFKLTPGVHKVGLRLVSEFDEVNSDDTLQFQVIGSYRREVISINEIMASPSDEQGGEWIEILNISDEPVSLQGWSISDANATRHEITDSLKFLAPDSMLVLCAQQQTLQFFTLQSEIAWVLDSWPTLNSTSDSIRLYDATDHIVSRAYYKGSWGSPAKSLERRHPSVFPLEAWNWSSSTHLDGATPAAINTQIMGNEAIQVEQIALNVYNPIGPTSVRVNLYFKNIGLDTLRELLIESQGLHQWSGELPSFQPDYISFLSEELNSGVSMVPMRIYSGDHLLTDTSFTVTLGFSPGRLALNEIHFLPHEDQTEFLELINIGNDTLDLNNWIFKDRSGTAGQLSSALLIPPDSIFTLCEDSLILAGWSPANARIIEVSPWPSLNNSSDSILIFDPLGMRQLTHAYEDDQGGEYGKSMERRHPRLFPLEAWNWASSIHVDGVTPSAVNSQLLDRLDVRIDRINVDLQESIVPSSVEIELHFSNLGLDTLRTLSIESNGVQQWAGELPSFQSDSINFFSYELGAGVSHVPIRIFAEEHLLADTSLTIILGFSPGQLALNEIHYLPHEDQTEFLELINIGDDTLDLNDWIFKDRSGTTGKLSSIVLIPPDSLFLLCEDSLALADWSPVNARIIEVYPWPSLNNSSDSILIFDVLGIRQLTHEYEEDQGGEYGRSMERTALWKPAEDWWNWSTCIDPKGITPGRLNSIQNPPDNLILSEIRLLESDSLAGENIQLELEVVNAGAIPQTSIEIEVEIDQGDNWSVQFDFSLPLILSQDTLRQVVELEVEHCGWLNITAEVFSVNDDLADDNKRTLRSYVSCLESPLIINEFMPVPYAGQTEWVEVINRSERVVDLQGWQLSDNSLSGKTWTDSSLKLEAGGYLLLSDEPEINACAWDCFTLPIAGFPTLNNSADIVVLFDPLGSEMDTVSYDEFSALVEGRSRERIRTTKTDSDNWGLCINESGATPGYENSLHLTALSQQLDIELDPNPFTPNGDGQQDELIIRYELPVEQALMSIMIYDMAGRKIAEPVQIRAIAHRGQVSWDGMTSYGGIAATGLYICKLLIDDLQGNVSETLRKVYLHR